MSTCVMPEGDTILRTARTLARAIGGRTVVRYASPLPSAAAADLAGRAVSKVEARGKNLLIRFDDGRTLLSHMKMDGTWHIYRPGERWQMPAHRAVAEIETDAWVAVCFDTDQVELLRAGGEARHDRLRELGPDILAEPFDEAEALRRFRMLPDTAIGEALLDQRLAAGIGNIYKSESLFAMRLDPWAKVRDLPDDVLRALLRTARAQLQAGVSRSRRPAWSVYDRSGATCQRCGGAIRMKRQGDLGRSTYFCPACQRGAAPVPRT